MPALPEIAFGMGKGIRIEREQLLQISFAIPAKAGTVKSSLK